MPKAESTRANGAVNPDTFEHDLLGFSQAGLAVRVRPDLDAVEILVRGDGSVEDVVILAPVQAIEVAKRLVAAVFALARSDGHG